MKKIILGFSILLIMIISFSTVYALKLNDPLVSLEKLKSPQTLDTLAVSNPQRDSFHMALYITGHLRWTWYHLFPQSLMLFQTTHGLLRTEELDEPTANAMNNIFEITATQPTPLDTVPRMMSHWGALNMYWSVADKKWHADPTLSYGAAHDKLEFCRRVYPNTLALRPYAYEEVAWSDASGKVGEVYDQISYECVQPEGELVETPFTESAKVDWTTILSELRPNKKDIMEVKAVQQLLKDEGVYTKAVDGVFGKETDKAIKKLDDKYQKLEDTNPLFNSELKQTDLETAILDYNYPFNGKIEQCILDNVKVYTVEPNAYEGGEIILDQKMKEKAECNVGFGTVDASCKRLKACTPVYVTDNNIWGENDVYKTNIKSVVNFVVKEYQESPADPVPVISQ